jgi:hypothetical protein
MMVLPGRKFTSSFAKCDLPLPLGPARLVKYLKQEDVALQMWAAML